MQTHPGRDLLNALDPPCLRNVPHRETLCLTCALNPFLSPVTHLLLRPLLQLGLYSFISAKASLTRQPCSSFICVSLGNQYEVASFARVSRQLGFG